MAELNVDPEDVAFAMAAFVGNSIVVGIAAWSLFGFSFGDTAFTINNTQISYAFLMAVVAFVGTVITNDRLKPTELHDVANSRLKNGNLDYGELYYYAVIACVALPVAWVLVPQVSEFFTSSDAAGLAYVAVFQLGQAVVGYVL